jgi:hypothetical protein
MNISFDLRNNLVIPKEGCRMMRCINEDDLDYVDVPIPSATRVEHRDLILKNAGFLSGFHYRNDLDDSVFPKEFHYYYLYRYPLHTDELRKNVLGMVGMDETKKSRISVCPLTNEIRATEKMISASTKNPKFYDGRKLNHFVNDEMGQIAPRKTLKR